MTENKYTIDEEDVVLLVQGDAVRVISPSSVAATATYLTN
jgi:hypothetical protein